VIFSVPHTGTRTLREYLCRELGVSWNAEDEHYSTRVTALHFGENDRDIETFNNQVDIPIRDPFDVAISWEARYTGLEYPELALWDKLIAYTTGRPQTTFHRIEDIKDIRIGEGPKHWARDKKRRKKALTMPRIVALREWIQEGARLEFFQQFYPKLWWL